MQAMAAYFIASYDVSDPDTYEKYNPGSMGVIVETMARYGGKILVAGGGDHWYAGKRHVLVVLEFPTAEAAQAWESDADYGKVKGFRAESTTNEVSVVAEGFVPKT